MSTIIMPMALPNGAVAGESPSQRARVFAVCSGIGRHRGERRQHDGTFDRSVVECIGLIGEKVERTDFGAVNGQPEIPSAAHRRFGNHAGC